IYLGDCREILPTLEKGDLVLTDPPYGIDIASKGQVGGSVLATNTRHIVSGWDSERLLQSTINYILRAGHTQMIFGGNYIADLLPPSPCWLVWNKRGDYPSNNFADCELIWTSMIKPSRIYKYFWQGMLQQDMKNKEPHYHPTQKPTSLMKWCILQADEAQTILDPFMGSGSTLRAALDLNRKCIGIEIEEKYCEIAAKRCSQSVMELNI
ncbi:hypothetical protein LCGC14_2778660, partial [marine sediment metagenome]